MTRRHRTADARRGRRWRSMFLATRSADGENRPTGGEVCWIGGTACLTRGEVRPADGRARETDGEARRTQGETRESIRNAPEIIRNLRETMPPPLIERIRQAHRRRESPRISEYGKGPAGVSAWTPGPFSWRRAGALEPSPLQDEHRAAPGARVVAADNVRAFAASGLYAVFVLVIFATRFAVGSGQRTNSVVTPSGSMTFA